MFDDLQEVGFRFDFQADLEPVEGERGQESGFGFSYVDAVLFGGQNGFDSGYQEFKIGQMLRNARTKSGITQDELARRLRTTKSAISRIENHAEDIRLSTLKKVAEALGKELTVAIS